MKIVISPAKSLDFNRTVPTSEFSQPRFLAEAERLNKLLKKKSARSLSKLMSISDSLSRLNYERNQEWCLPFSETNARAAVFAFSGDVYRGLDSYNLSGRALDALQEKVRIISGLYGLLKPLDLIQPYRLEMGTRMKIGRNKNLYEFWRKKITPALNEELEEDEIFVNLASKEYFKAVDLKTVNGKIITPVFKDLKNGEYKMIMTFAKQARGYMTRYLVETKAETIDDIKGFNYEGYGLSESLSTATELVFIR